MTNITTIEDQASFDQLCESLSGADFLALDTEFMREKTYSPLLALIQVADQDNAVCIDPLAIQDISKFGALLEQPDLEIVLHSCRQDMEAFETRFPVIVHGLFDTQIAAAFCGYGDQVSYAAMVERVCGVELAKSHTRADWSRRPLSDSELTYALDDVRYLREVQLFLRDKLEDNGRLAWFEAECIAQSDPANWRVDPEDAWLRLKGGAGLPAAAHETARALAVWRERRAMKRNLPREWVMSSQTLLDIARKAPSHRTELAAIDGVHRNLLKHNAQEVLAIVEQTPRSANAAPLWRARDMLAPEEKQRVKKVMSLLRDTAEKLEISPSLMANRATVERYVRGDRSLALFEGWRRDVVGDRILAESL